MQMPRKNEKNLNLDQRFGRTPGDEQPSREKIAQVAYELYLKRGGEHGRDWEDWFQAEGLLKEKREFHASGNPTRR